MRRHSMITMKAKSDGPTIVDPCNGDILPQIALLEYDTEQSRKLGEWFAQALSEMDLVRSEALDKR